MSAPVLDTVIVARGLSRLTGAFANQPNIRAWLTVILQPFQDIENAAFGVLGARTLATATLKTLPATNPVLDSLGALVGQARDGLSDGDYQATIYLRIAVDRSRARVSDWSTFAAILLRTCPGPVAFLDDGGAIYFGVWNMALNANVVAAMLSSAPGNGVGGTFAYSTWPDGDDFGFGDVSDATAGQAGYGDTVDTTAGGLLVSGAMI